MASKAPIQNSSNTSKTGLVYKSISDLPLHNFIEITITGDLKWLIIEGEPQDLDEHWANIYSEYDDVVGAGGESKGLSLAKQITMLTNKLTVIKNLIQYLRVKRSERLIELLTADYGFKFKYTDLQKDLNRTETLLKTDELKLIKLTADYEKLSESKGMTREDFTDILVSLSKHLGYMPNKHKITVAEYVSMIKDFKRYNSPKNGK